MKAITFYFSNSFISTFLVIFFTYFDTSWAKCYARCTCRSAANIACTEVSNHPFKQIPDFLTQFNYDIRQITIKNQNIQNLTPETRNALNFVPNVEQISITASNVTYIQPHTFNAGFRRVTSLDLSRNAIKEIPKAAFYGLQNVTEISLAKNQISAVDENFFGTYSLRPWSKNLVIKLNENKLETFPGNFVSRVETFIRLNLPTTTRVTIDLSYNPIRCDCSIYWLVSANFFHVEIIGTCDEKKSFFEVQGTSLQRLKETDSFSKCKTEGFLPFKLLSMQALLIGIGSLTVLIIVIVCVYNKISECVYERRMLQHTGPPISGRNKSPSFTYDISLI